MEHADARIETDRMQSYRHFAFENRVQIIQERIPGRHRSVWFPGEYRGSLTERKTRIGSAGPPLPIGTEPLRVPAGEPYRPILPLFPVHRSGPGFVGQLL